MIMMIHDCDPAYGGTVGLLMKKWLQIRNDREYRADQHACRGGCRITSVLISGTVEALNKQKTEE